MTPSGLWEDDHCWDNKNSWVCQYYLPHDFETVTLCSNLNEDECHIEKMCVWNHFDKVCAVKDPAHHCPELQYAECGRDDLCTFDRTTGTCIRAGSNLLRLKSTK